MDEPEVERDVEQKLAALEWCSRRSGNWRPTSPAGSVYVLWGEHTRWFKVGFTAGSVDRRAYAIAESLPFRVRILGSVPGTRRMEADVHRILAPYRTNGEWFDLPEPVAWAIIRWVGLEAEVAGAA
jgi:hypothetical protein